MILDKIRGFLGLKKKGDEKEIIISCERLERRVAVLEGGRLEEFSIERESDRQISGSIYKGRVKNLEPGLKAMFVDIGLDKNAFLHYWDAIPSVDAGVETVDRGKGRRGGQKKITANDIPRIYPPGSDIIVQVTKGPIGTKGPRITTNISLPGRYLVLMPFDEQSGISKKIEDPKERQRLRRILQDLNVPDGMGVIIRTVGEGQKARFFVRDFHVLLEEWKKISGDVQTARAPKLLLPEPDLIERTVRSIRSGSASSSFGARAVSTSPAIRCHWSSSTCRSRTKKRAFWPSPTVRIITAMPSGRSSSVRIRRRRWRSFGSSILREIPH